jgi:hypothetical protein
LKTLAVFTDKGILMINAQMGKDVSHHLKSQQATNNMNVANTYAVMNVIHKHTHTTTRTRRI